VPAVVSPTCRMMGSDGEQARKREAAQASTMLLSLLFSIWLAIGGAAWTSDPSTTEFRHAATPKVVVLQAAAGKHAHQPRQPHPTPTIPELTAPVFNERFTYPVGAQALELIAPRVFAGAAPYQARAPPAL